MSVYTTYIPSKDLKQGGIMMTAPMMTAQDLHGVPSIEEIRQIAMEERLYART